MKEITVVAKLAVKKGFGLTKDDGTIKVDMTGTSFVNSVQTIGTAHEQITVPADVSTAGYAYFLNTGATNYIEIGLVVSSTFYAFLKLKPGEMGVMRLATTTIYAKANTAPVTLEYVMLQD